MKVITEERLAKVINSICDQNEDINGITELISALEEIDTLTVNEPDLILAAEKYAGVYSDDDRQDIKADVLNAFYHGAEWQKKHKQELTGDGNG